MALPSPCKAFSQALSVNSLRRRIRGERVGHASLLRLDHVTRDSLAARNNEAYGLGNEWPTCFCAFDIGYESTTH